MKCITEVLGSLQFLLPLDFDFQEVFESYLTREHKGFLSLLRVIEPFVEMLSEGNHHMGRPSYNVLPFLSAALAKRYFKIVATSDLRLRLLSDAKSICQFVRGGGRIPIIDQNPRRKPSRAPFDEATNECYKKRSVVERPNSHLKDWLLRRSYWCVVSRR